MAHLFRLSTARGALRIWAAGIAVAAVAAVATLGLSASAHAVVTSIPTETSSAVVGLQPRNATYWVDGRGSEFGDEEPFTFSNKEGNPVLHSTNVYAIYWDPTRYDYHGDWQHTINLFLQNLGNASSSFANVLTVDEQYTDKANEGAAYSTTFRGAYTDTEPYPVLGNCTDPHPMEPEDQVACLTDHELQQQLEHFITTHSLQKGMGTIFYLLTPPGVTVCVDGGGPTGHCSDYAATVKSYENSFCSYHSDISPTSPLTGDANTILYAVIPWTAGGKADLHLARNDRTAAYECQDGGFDPSSHPIEQHEEEHELGEKEKEELKKDSPAERQKLEEAHEREGPHEEEPNQPTAEVGPDGTYDGGLADLIVNQIAIEQQNTTTDPLLDAWQDVNHNEATDECRNFFAPIGGGGVAATETADAGTLYNQTFGEGHYYLNTAFNLAALKINYPGVPCLLGINQMPQFTAPNAVNAGDIVGFDGMESDITLDAGTKYSASGEEQTAYSTFTWNFGDGTPPVAGSAPGAPAGNSPSTSSCGVWSEPCAGSAFHTYQYGGTYNVTLTVTDVAGHTESVIHPITVDGPPPPSSGGGSGGGSGSSAGGSPALNNSTTNSSGAGNGGPPTTPGLPGPVAKAAAIGSSLGQAVKRGLLVSYSVNEQVAGHFEVLLAAATAKRLGIKGGKAFGLPAGQPESLIVGQALLVTTKGGHSMVRIKLTKSAAQRLRHVHKVTLLLRLSVRNASPQHPQSTTVLTPVVLHR